MLKGLHFFENGKTYRTPFRPLIKDLDELQFPDRDLSLTPTEAEKQSIAHIITSRGCPYNCNFCSTSKYWGNHIRFRSPSNIVDEIELLKNKYKIQKISIVDDMFTVSKKRTMEFCNELIKRNIKIEWSCSTRVDAIDREMIKIMKKAGCSGIFYGIESTNNASLSESNKLFDFKQVKDAIKITTSEGINVVEAFIIGLPFQSINDIQNILQFANKTFPTLERANFTILKLLPGTEFGINPGAHGIEAYTPPLKSFYGQTDMKSFTNIKNGLSSKVITNIFWQDIRDFWKNFYSILPWEEIPSPTIENDKGGLR